MEILSEEQKKQARQMLASETWKIARGLLERLSIKKEREKAESLRAHSFDLSNRLQGILDGIDYAIDTIESMALKEKAIEEGPIY